MRKLLFLLPFLLMLIFSVALYFRLTLPIYHTDPMVGKRLPAVELSELTHPGQFRDVSKLSQDVHIIHVISSWCDACKYEQPLLDGLAKTGFIDIHLIFWRDEEEIVQKMLPQLESYKTILLDKTGEQSIELGIKAAPETFLVGSDGIVIQKWNQALNKRIIRDELLPIIFKIKNSQ